MVEVFIRLGCRRKWLRLFVSGWVLWGGCIPSVGMAGLFEDSACVKHLQLVDRVASALKGRAVEDMRRRARVDWLYNVARANVSEYKQIEGALRLVNNHSDEPMAQLLFQLKELYANANEREALSHASPVQTGPIPAALNTIAELLPRIESDGHLRASVNMMEYRVRAAFYRFLVSEQVSKRLSSEQSLKKEVNTPDGQTELQGIVDQFFEEAGKSDSSLLQALVYAQPDQKLRDSTEKFNQMLEDPFGADLAQVQADTSGMDILKRTLGNSDLPLGHQASLRAHLAFLEYFSLPPDPNSVNYAFYLTVLFD